MSKKKIRAYLSQGFFHPSRSMKPQLTKLRLWEPIPIQAAPFTKITCNQHNKDLSNEIIRTQIKTLINTKYKNHKIFKDGSKIKEPFSTLAAFYIKQKKITTIWKLSRNTQILEAELCAIK